MIVGVIVTFNPHLCDLVRNVKIIFPQVDKLVIFDNASRNRNKILSNSWPKNIDWVLSDVNVGLGSAYNNVIDKYSSDFEYLITFDQDTRIGKDLVYNLLKLFEMGNVGIVGPTLKKSIQNKRPIREVPALLQSASIYKMDIFKKIGGFNTEYFIDSVDFEICLRAKIYGFRVLMSNLDYINHNLGSSKKFLMIDFISHSPFRNFYIARNHVNLSIRYFRFFPYFILKKNVFFILHFLKLIFLERNTETVISFLKGLVSGFNLNVK